MPREARHFTSRPSELRRHARIPEVSIPFLQKSKQEPKEPFCLKEKASPKMPFKDWCRDCKFEDTASDWCVACMYKLLREQIVAEPTYYKRKF